MGLVVALQESDDQARKEANVAGKVSGRLSGGHMGDGLLSTATVPCRQGSSLVDTGGTVYAGLWKHGEMLYP